jgi:sugar lactone lactonase YvrE
MSLRVELRARTSDNRGIYYAETKRAVIYLSNHEDLEDIYKTINHETYHHCFSEAGEADDMDEDQEERLIFCMAWAEHSIA